MELEQIRVAQRRPGIRDRRNRRRRRHLQDVRSEV